MENIVSSNLLLLHSGIIKEEFWNCHEYLIFEDSYKVLDVFPCLKVHNVL